ncbi:glycosyltransferase family 61 protein [Methylohalobius crimeensis]|uniref:glycosyltransferase family 61 protein n=1 Tax=Methylohalobius crimeensis TaxID=244365 RepID=UPI0003B52185|nr:glycosyltransferase family 61 protein [Methylohalobius crimeensis]
MKLPDWILNRLVRGDYLEHQNNIKHEKFIRTRKIPCPEFTFMPFREEAKHLQVEHYDPPDLFSVTLQGYYYYSYLNVVLNKYRTILLESDNTHGEHPDRPLHHQFYWRYLYFPSEKIITGPSNIFRSSANNYYHTLIDTIPRLYLLLHEYQGCRIKLLVPGKLQPWEEYFLPKILPKNIHFEYVSHKKIYKTDELILNSFMSRPFCGYLPDFYLDFFVSRFTPNRSRKKKNRIFVSRKHAAGNRKIKNETEVLNIIEPFGFKPYILEDLAISDQIELFYDADIIIAPHGAGLTNIIFSKNASIIELHPEPTITPHYFFLSKSLDHDYHYLTSDGEGRFSDFSVDIHKLKSILNTLDIKKYY